ncbi:MAG: DMT family transporter [Armatimonadota bacterium]|nr:DMT family transporter [Armatimonadota bacterium]
MVEDARGPHPLVADLALLAVAGFWGLTFPLGKIVLAVLGPFTYLAVRFTIGALLIVTGTPSDRLTMAWQRWAQALGVGTVFFLGYAFQTVGLRLTTASKTAFITGLSTVIVPVISAVWLRRPPRAGVLAGILLASGGLALLTLTEAVAVQTGDWLVLGCAVCFAFHIVLVGRLARAIEPLAFAAAQVVPVGLFSTLAAVPERPLLGLVSAGAAVWAMIVFMAATGTVFAMLVQTWAQRYTTPSHVGLVFTFEPVAAALAAYLILGEVPSARQAVGAALILAGILASELNLTPRDVRHPRSPEGRP